MSEPKSEYKVEVKNLTKYFGDLHVLNDISFNVRKGEFICIVGPTGCGKTTFLNLLTRIYMPSKGDLLIDGESADPKKHNLAFVFQEPSSIPWKTVEENLRFGLELKKLPKKEIDERVENIPCPVLPGGAEWRGGHLYGAAEDTARPCREGRGSLFPG